MRGTPGIRRNCPFCHEKDQHLASSRRTDDAPGFPLELKEFAFCRAGREDLQHSVHIRSLFTFSGLIPPIRGTLEVARSNNSSMSSLGNVFQRVL